MKSRIAALLGVLLLAGMAQATAITQQNVLGGTNGPLAGSGTGVGTDAINAQPASPFDAGTPLLHSTVYSDGWTYSVTGLLSGNSTTYTAKNAIVDTAGAISGSWSNPGTADWIGICDCVTTDFSSITNLTFSMNYIVPAGFNATTGTITFDWMASDTTALVYVAGRTLTVGNFPTISAGFGGYNQITLNNTNCNGCFDAGTLDFKIIFQTPSTSYDGINVYFQTADDGVTAPATPEPGSAALMLSGVGAIVFAIRRRNRARR